MPSRSRSALRCCNRSCTLLLIPRANSRPVVVDVIPGLVFSFSFAVLESRPLAAAGDDDNEPFTDVEDVGLEVPFVNVVVVAFLLLLLLFGGELDDLEVEATGSAAGARYLAADLACLLELLDPVVPISPLRRRRRQRSG